MSFSQLLKNKKVLIAAAAVLAAVGAYFLFFSGSGGGSEPVLGTADFTSAGLISSLSASPSGGVGQDLLVTLSRLRSIKLDTGLFSSPSFSNLEDLSVAIAPQPAGRKNPFLPLGASAAAPAPVRPIAGGTPRSLLPVSAPTSGTAVPPALGGTPRLATAAEGSAFDRLFKQYVAARRTKDTATLVSTFGYLPSQAASLPSEDVWNFSSYSLYRAVVKSVTASQVAIEAYYIVPYASGSSSKLLFLAGGAYNTSGAGGFIDTWQLYPSSANPQVYPDAAGAESDADGMIADALSAAGQ